jgi:RNA 3'-terminal phosphate cyclase (ATP)
MIQLDGSEGEGGGQILRSALSLSICTQQPFQIVNIRARRAKPGLLAQHLIAVRAAAAISNAEVRGAELGSQQLAFAPRPVRAGDYSFEIGTAGSCTLVLQTILPPLLTAHGVSTVRITGGTHNPAAPPVEFLSRTFLPLLNRMGASVELELLRHGFFPRGGGRIHARIRPCAQWLPIELLERGAKTHYFAEAYVAGIPSHIAQRELTLIGDELSWQEEQLKLRALSSEVGPGNAIAITLGHENITEVFSGVGEKRSSAETVAMKVIADVRKYLSSDAVVGEHLADQLLIPMAFGGVSSFSTFEPSMHFLSNAKVIEIFTGMRFGVENSNGACVVTKVF